MSDLVPYLEEGVPGAGADRHAVLRDAETRHPVVVARQHSCGGYGLVRTQTHGCKECHYHDQIMITVNVFVSSYVVTDRVKVPVDTRNIRKSPKIDNSDISTNESVETNLLSLLSEHPRRYS